MISTLFITLIIESIVTLAYSAWHGKPIRSILLTSIFINPITQLLLWIVLNTFYQSYVLPLLLTEIVIWMIESLALFSVPTNHLELRDAMFLSLSMNLLSFMFGWFLPV